MYFVVVSLFNYQKACSEIWTDKICTLQLLFFSLSSGMMEGFQVCEGLLEKTK